MKKIFLLLMFLANFGLAQNVVILPGVVNNLTTNFGATVTLSVANNGYTNCSWTLNGRLQSQGASGDGTNFYFSFVVSSNTVGDYYASLGTATSYLQVLTIVNGTNGVVNSTPVFTQQPRNTTNNIGDVATFTVLTTDPNATYSWFSKRLVRTLTVKPTNYVAKPHTNTYTNTGVPPFPVVNTNFPTNLYFSNSYYISNLNVNSNVLTINVMSNSFLSYFALASNSFGSATSSVAKIYKAPLPNITVSLYWTNTYSNLVSYDVFSTTNLNNSFTLLTNVGTNKFISWVYPKTNLSNFPSNNFFYVRANCLMTSNNVTLTWNTVTNAMGYFVWQTPQNTNLTQAVYVGTNSSVTLPATNVYNNSFSFAVSAYIINPNLILSAQSPPIYLSALYYQIVKPQIRIIQ